MSIERAKELLGHAQYVDQMPLSPHGSTVEELRERSQKAHGLRMEAVVLAVEALIERLEADPAGGQAKAHTCRVCRGSGSAFGPNPNKPCAACGGSGVIR